MKLAYRLLTIDDQQAIVLDDALGARRKLSRAERHAFKPPELVADSLRLALAWAWGVLAQDKPGIAVLGPLFVVLMPAMFAVIATHWRH